MAIQGRVFNARVFEQKGKFYWVDEHAHDVDKERSVSHPSKVSACRAAIQYAIDRGVFDQVILRGDGVTRRARLFGDGAIQVVLMA